MGRGGTSGAAGIPKGVPGASEGPECERAPGTRSGSRSAGKSPGSRCASGRGSRAAEGEAPRAEEGLREAEGEVSARGCR